MSTQRESIIVSVTKRKRTPSHYSVRNGAKDVVSVMEGVSTNLLERFSMVVYKDRIEPKSRTADCKFIDNNILLFENYSMRNGPKDISSNVTMKVKSLEEKYLMDVYKDSNIIKARKAVGTDVTDKCRVPKHYSMHNGTEDIANCMIYSDALLEDETTYVYYGDELMWDTLGCTWIKLGSSKNPSYPASRAWKSDDGVNFESATYNWTDSEYQLHDGWDYTYDLNTSIFNITDDTGKIIYVANTTELGMFRISYDVLSSHQFKILFTAHHIGDWKYEGQMNKRRGTDYDEKHIEKERLNPATIPTYARIIPSEVPTFSILNEILYEIKDIPQTMMFRPIGSIRLRRSDYSVYGVICDDREIVAEPTKVRLANLFEEAMILWSFTFEVINNRGKSTIEPWMLWNLWQYSGNAKLNYLEERIFDISPNWS